MFHISNWVDKCMLTFFQKACAGANEGNFFSGYSQKVRKGDFFKVIRVTIEKQVCEVQRKHTKLTF